MDVSEREFEAAGARMAGLREAGRAIGARYDPDRSRVVVVISALWGHRYTVACGHASVPMIELHFMACGGGAAAMLE